MVLRPIQEGPFDLAPTRMTRQTSLAQNNLENRSLTREEVTLENASSTLASKCRLQKGSVLPHQSGEASKARKRKGSISSNQRAKACKGKNLTAVKDQTSAPRFPTEKVALTKNVLVNKKPSSTEVKKRTPAKNIKLPVKDVASCDTKLKNVRVKKTAAAKINVIPKAISSKSLKTAAACVAKYVPSSTAASPNPTANVLQANDTSTNKFGVTRQTHAAANNVTSQVSFVSPAETVYQLVPLGTVKSSSAKGLSYVAHDLSNVARQAHAGANIIAPQVSFLPPETVYHLVPYGAKISESSFSTSSSINSLRYLAPDLSDVSRARISSKSATPNNVDSHFRVIVFD